MSWLPDSEPHCCPAQQGKKGSVDIVITPNTRDLEGFSVRRALPAVERRAVGPFVFFDHMGPAQLSAAGGLAVRPHPHIGLSTLTYLYEGEIVHRDSLGFKQLIRPGAVNWMTAGRGIVHSERSPESAAEQRLMGLQVWAALPKEQEQCAPSFTHYSTSSVPEAEADGARIRVVAGECFGMCAKLQTSAPLFFVDVQLQAQSRLLLEAEYTERAFYVVSGDVAVGSERFSAGQMVVLKPDSEVILSSQEGASLAVIGGEPLDGPRHIWWNFVATERELIEQAKADWQAGRFGHVPGDSEFVPLPG
ncbi:pirin family protein [Gilvimarinus sp. DA14]|uniref:pirin family protein n=1 Tax=Gilvimarinus sp. DA14 TaxID=2956798 RepID=UPI0020B6CC29|nr:pirin family protein [Gilvimarinus sp. DA14]UTF59195.1 pirin family protein [Gilvimarinus sp. DA14]